MPVSKKTAATLKPPTKKPTKKAPAKAPVTTESLSAQVVGPANPLGLPVKYPTLQIVERSTASKAGPITPNDMKAFLGWETESQYQERKVKEDPTSKPENWLYGDDYHCRNTDGEKVRCRNNSGNRPFDSDWCEDLIHTNLYGQWAGPLTVPGETVNGETVRISRYGRMLSAQHQGTALILADEYLQKSRAEERNAVAPKYPFWNGHDHVVIETIIVFGVSEDERILRTIDYVKPRTVADMLYTMELFRNKTSVERKEMTRMLATAIDVLWARTDTKGYKTHPEIVGFLERHKRLLKCVEHLFIENGSSGGKGGRKIAKLGISPGLASAVCYLMGCSGDETDGDEYRNECPPSERNLDWSNWDRARQFWFMLATDRLFSPLRQALEDVMKSSPTHPDNQGMGGTTAEKLALLSKAWEVYKTHPDTAGPPFTMDDLLDGGALDLAYNNLDDRGNVLPNEKIKLLDEGDFFGIDCPDSLNSKTKRRITQQAPPEVTEMNQEEYEKAKEAARVRREEQRQKLLDKRGK